MDIAPVSWKKCVSLGLMGDVGGSCALSATGGAWECRPEREPVENILRKALTAEDAERAERGLWGRLLVEERYSWRNIADSVVAACN